MFQLVTFGGLALVDGTGSVVAAQRRRLALLALVAAAGARGMRRDKILGYLWPESPGPNARHALEQLVYALRQQVDLALFRGTDPLHLNPDVVTSDVAAFEDAVSRGAVADAVALYTGPFLDGFYVGDAGEFERWVEAERARLAERCATALEKHAKEASVGGDHRAAVAAWRRLAALEPLGSRPALGLMEALADAGDRAEALRVGRAHGAVVRSDLGAEPAAAVTALMERLASQPAPRVPAPAAAQVEPGFTLGSKPLPRPGRRRVPRLALAAGVAAVAFVLVALTVLGRPAPTTIRSLAVLPLRNLSGDSAQEFFAEGMTDALVTLLGKTGGLRVISYSSAMRFKGSRETLPEIARQLHVDAVVEGAVLRAGNRVRVTAQLVAAPDDRHLWAETYERDLGDVLELQDAIARAITSEVRLRLSGAPPTAVASSRARPVDPDAYDLYLRGRTELFGRTEQGFRRSIAYFEDALGKDSSYAPAWAGLSDAYQFLGQFNLLPPHVAWAKSRAAALRALELDASLSEAHVSLAWIRMHVDRSWPLADRAFKQAIALNPNDAWAHQAYGYVLSARGEFDAAIAATRRALELDPFSANKENSLAAVFYRAGRYDSALRHFRDVPDPDVNSVSRHQRIATIYERQGLLDAALAERLLALRLGGMEQLAATVERAYRESGYAAARRAYISGDLREALRRVNDAYPRPRTFDIASDYALLGQHDQAFEWLERSYRDAEGVLLMLGVDDRFESLRSDPRFSDLVRRIGLPAR